MTGSPISQETSGMKPQTQQSFPKSATPAEKGRLLLAMVGPDDTLAIMIKADPDALKRLFWRKAKKIVIYHLNPIQRADNLAVSGALTCGGMLGKQPSGCLNAGGPRPEDAKMPPGPKCRWRTCRKTPLNRSSLS
jgi:hypothetical protein